ncbi:transglutaminase domain-containing protein [Candidatus Woesearchaeota archaeon]|nr:MAG: transglutaminase domain-containing protein [Candidatus Woesearchaeota archaeon]
MKKGVLLFAVFMLFMLTKEAIAEEPAYNVKERVMDFNLTGEINLHKTSQDWLLSHVIAKLSFFPREDYRQEVLSLETIPESTNVNGTALRFFWKDPLFETQQFKVNARVKATNNFVPVNKVIGFPLQSFGGEEYYLQHGEHIDSENPDIIAVASELAEGESNMYNVIFNIVKWIEDNINYSLNTLTAEVAQSASWTLKNRYGVCDEITSLFVAMLRSLGIPAKYVSGVAYTNWDDRNDWGPHAWAEVYFPTIGWVPFDLTYKQYGYVDASHIKLKESLDSSEPSTNYEWRGRNVELSTKPLDMKVRTVDMVPDEYDDISFQAKVSKESVGFGSYNLVFVEIENMRDYFQITDFQLSKPKELELLGKNRRLVLLEPFEKKIITWIVKVPKQLDRHSRYIFPISVYTQKNQSSKTEFDSTIDDETYSLSVMESLSDSLEENEEKVISKSLELKCSPLKEFFYTDEKVKFECKLKNKGNTFLQGIKLCFEDCETLDLGISQEYTKNFNVTETKQGIKEYVINASNREVSEQDSFIVKVSDLPKISIADLEYPVNVSFDEEFSVTFLLRKESISTPKDVKLKVSLGHHTAEWNFTELLADKPFKISMNGSILEKRTPGLISLTYKDARNRQYSEEEKFGIILNRLTFGQKIRFFFNRFAAWLAGILF